MFHFALPELNTLGVTTAHAGLHQVGPGGDVLGVPGAHDEGHDGVGDHALGRRLVAQLLETRPALTTLPMSGSSEKLTTSAGSPSTTEVAWVPEGPKEGETVTPAPALVLAKSAASTV